MKKIKNKPKKLALAMAIVICVSCIPQMAFADGYTPPIGGSEPTITVTDKNGVATKYEDIYKDNPQSKTNITDQNRFFRDALTMASSQYDKGAYKDWLSLAYNVLKANPDSYDDFHNGNGDAYDVNRYGKEFDDYFGGGKSDGKVAFHFYNDLRKPADTTNKSNPYYNTRKSIVLGLANSLDEVQEKAYKTLNDTLHGRWSTGTFRKYNEIEEFTKHKEIEGPVVYSLVTSLTASKYEKRYNTMGSLFMILNWYRS